MELAREYVEQLAERLTVKWAAVGYDDDAFPTIAAEELEGHPPARIFNRNDLLSWLADAKNLPYQPDHDDHFGQPHVTLWWSCRFQIDALFWYSATADAHQHKFSGAFSVVDGKSVQTTYTCVERARLSSKIILATVAKERVELLDVGDVRPIGRDRRLVHSLFHLDAPTITLLVKSSPTESGEPEYVYCPPALVFDPVPSPIGRKQLQALESLLRMQTDDVERYATLLVSGFDSHTALLVLIRLCTAAIDSAALERVVRAAHARYPAIAEAVLQGVDGERRRKTLLHIRQQIHDPDSRLLLFLCGTGVPRPDAERIVDARPDRDGLTLSALARRCIRSVEPAVIGEGALKNQLSEWAS